MLLNGHPLLTGAFLVLLAWMCLATILRACTLPRGVARGGSCGKCGYTYSGWTRCPECGGDVADVGVATPSLAARFRGGWVGIVIGLLMVGFAVTIVLESTLVELCRARKWLTIEHKQMFASSGAHNPPFGMVIHWESIVAGEVVTGGRIRVVIDGAKRFTAVGPGIDATLGLPYAEIDLPSGRFVVRDATGEAVHKGTSFHAREAAAFLERCSLPLSDEENQLLGAQIAETVRVDFAADPYGLRGMGAPVMYAGSSAGAKRRTLPFSVLGLGGSKAILAMSVAGAGVVVAGLGGLIVRRRRRLLRALSLATTSTEGATAT